jgi:signal transduction histidine kinase
MNESAVLDSLKKVESLVYSLIVTNPSEALYYAKSGLSLALSGKFPSALVKANSIVGYAYRTTKQDSGFFYYSESLKLANRYGITNQKANVFCDLSKIYSSASDFKTSIIMLDSAKRLAILELNYKVLSDVYNELGSIKLEISDSIDARKMFDSALLIARKHYIFTQVGAALGNLATLESNVTQSIYLNKQAIINLKKSAGTETIIASILINIGFLQDNPDSAIYYYSNALNTLESLHLDEPSIAAYNAMAYAYMDKTEYYKADFCLVKKAIPLAGHDKNYNWLSSLFDSYADLLIKENRPNDAALAAKKALSFKKKADAKQASDQVRLLAAILDSKNKEIRLGLYDRQVQSQTVRIQKMNLLVTILVLLIGTILFIALFIVQRTKLSTQRKLVESAKKIISIEEGLAERLSMELHDLTSPLYSSLLYEVEAVDIPDSTMKSEIQSKLKLLAEAIRNISHRMSAAFSEQLSFEEQVVGLCNDMQKLTRVGINLEIGLLDFQPSRENSNHIIRILQELLSNAVKHVEVGEINLKIFIDKKLLKILYIDNGQGFEMKSSKNKGLGLTSILERTKLMGGNANLISQPSSGTHWFITIPI